MAFDMFYFDYEHDTVGKKLLLTGMVLAWPLSIALVVMSIPLGMIYSIRKD